MSRKIKLDDTEYSVDNLGEKAKSTLASLQFVTTRLQELSNMQALMQRAKNSYVESLKQELISSKAGFQFGDD